MLTRLILLAILAFALVAPPARAGEKRSYIRDAEVENSIRAFATPLFQTAGLDPDAVRIHILLDPSLNAFVAGGQNLFIHTGLLIRAENVNQLIGVMAHETGHIAGGHIVRIQGELGNASAEAIVAMLLGTAVGAATGRGDAAAAIALGGQSMAMRSLLAYSREQESAADQAGLRFLDSTHQSAKGLLEFFDILGDQELLVVERQDPYVRTHPLTRDRIAFVREWVEKSPWSNAPPRPEFVEMFRRIRAKLFAFIEPPVRTLQRYKENDSSVEARYGRAIALYRRPDLPAALKLVDGLIAQRPDDPYFHELRGQILFENARGAEAVAPYRRAVDLLPNNALLRTELARSEVELDDPSLLKDAVGHLSRAVALEPDDSSSWHLLGIAYGKDGNEGMASYAMAEEALLTGNLSAASFLAGKAERLLPKSGATWLHIQDIKARAEEARRERKRKGED